LRESAFIRGRFKSGLLQSVMILGALSI